MLIKYFNVNIWKLNRGGSEKSDVFMREESILKNKSVVRFEKIDLRILNNCFHIDKLNLKF